MTEETDFGIDASKKTGRKSHCKACDRERAKAYYDAHKDEFYARRQAVREAEREAQLKALEKQQRKRLAAVRAAHEEGVRRQKALFAEWGLKF